MKKCLSDAERREAARRRSAEWRLRNPAADKAAYERDKLKYAPVRHANYVANKEKWWARSLQDNYGLSAFDFQRYLERQHYKCARCSKPFGATVPRVDHDHEIGRVRGLLCNQCNLKVHARGSIELTLKYIADAAQRWSVIDAA